jgi:hypothetical protein
MLPNVEASWFVFVQTGVPDFRSRNRPAYLSKTMRQRVPWVKQPTEITLPVATWSVTVTVAVELLPFAYIGTETVMLR